MTKVYKLSPLLSQLGHRDWEASTYVGECSVAAASEEMARQYATLAFIIATRADGYVRFCPWLQAELVACTEIDVDGEIPELGRVILPKEAGRPDFMAEGPNRGEIW